MSPQAAPRRAHQIEQDAMRECIAIGERDAAAIHRRRQRTGETLQQVLDRVPETLAPRWPAPQSN